MAAGTISAGAFGEEYDVADRHSSVGVMACFAAALAMTFFVSDAFAGLVWSQALLSVQLPITIFLQIYLTSSKRVMGRYANGAGLNVLLVGIGVVVCALNAWLLVVG
jgi:manganese transport protein